MPPVAVAVFSVFAVYGIICVVKELCEKLLGKFCDCDRIIIYVKTDCERLESVVRSLMIKNPNAEIIVAESDKSAEVREIADRLCRDCAKIHIGRVELRNNMNGQ